MLLAILPVALGLSAAACPSTAPGVSRVDNGAVSAEYRAVIRADGTRRLVGQYCSGERFVYDIKPNGKVVGWVGNRPVRFNARPL